MRAILVGSERERDELRWQLQGSGVAVVGEFAGIEEARASGIAADALLVPAVRGGRAPHATAADRDEGEPLTRREIEVLELLAEGLPNKAIATQLGISDQTVKFHVAQIIGKLGVANRTEAVRRALRTGILTV